MTSPDYQFLSYIVSATAVFISALAVWSSYRNQQQTLKTTRRIAQASREAERKKLFINELRAELSEYAIKHFYFVQAAYKAWHNGPEKKPFPSNKDEHELQLRLESLYHSMLMRLNPRKEKEAALLAAIESMRDCEPGDWIESRSILTEKAREMFQATWDEIDAKDTF